MIQNLILKMKNSRKLAFEGDYDIIEQLYAMYNSGDSDQEVFEICLHGLDDNSEDVESTLNIAKMIYELIIKDQSQSLERITMLFGMMNTVIETAPEHFENIISWLIQAKQKDVLISYITTSNDLMEKKALKTIFKGLQNDSFYDSIDFFRQDITEIIEVL